MRFEAAVLHGDVPQPLTELGQSFSRTPWSDVFWSLVVALAALVIGRLAAGLVMGALARWAKHTSSVTDDAVATHLPGPVKLLLPIGALRFALPVLTIPPLVHDLLGHVLLLIIVIGVGWLSFRGVRAVEDVIVKRYDLGAAENLHARAVHTQMQGFRNVAGFVIAVVTTGALLITFRPVRELGAGLLASAGVAGIVLGFAAQRTLATLLAGIQIAVSQPIRVDDVVVVEGEWGRIEEITLTYVVVRIWDLRRLIVPVNHFIEKPFQNWTRTSAELVGAVFLHLDYTLSIDALRKEFERVLEGSELWDHTVAKLQVTDTTPQAMVVRATMGARNATDTWDLRCLVREKLIAFVQTQPHGLPRVRASLDGGLTGALSS